MKKWTTPEVTELNISETANGWTAALSEGKNFNGLNITTGEYENFQTYPFYDESKKIEDPNSTPGNENPEETFS